MKIARKILKWFCITLVVVTVILFAAYGVWQSDKRESLVADSAILETSFGPVEYVLKGESGPVVLYFHGTPGGYDQSPPASETNRLLAFSRPGYLRTPLASGETPQQQAELAAELVATLNIHEVFPAGVSGGGPSAIAFALEFPELTKGLILLEAISQPPQSQVQEEAVPTFLQSDFYSDFLVWFSFEAILVSQGKTGFLPLLVSNPENLAVFEEDPAKLDSLIDSAWALWPPTNRIDGWQNDIQQKQTLNFAFEQIIDPVLLVHGTEDTNVSIAESEIVAERAPVVEYHRIEGGDHMMLLTHQEEIVELLEGFVDRVSRFE